jgi:hypothetical protein
MNEVFLQWAKEHEKDLLERGIVSEIPDLSKEVLEKKLQNPCQVVYFYSKTHLGFVSVWKSGIMDMEILNAENSNLEFYQHIDDVTKMNMDDILESFFKKM